MGARGRPRTGRGRGLWLLAAGRRWGVWSRLRARLQADPDRSAVRRDSTVVSAASAPKNQEAETARGRPLRVTGGPRRACTQA